MTDITLEKRARELLAAEYERDLMPDVALAIREGRLEGKFGCAARRALRAIEAALRLPDGEDWVLVPREPTPEMIEAAASFGGEGGYSSQRGDEAARSWRHMLAAAPRHEPGEGQVNG